MRSTIIRVGVAVSLQCLNRIFPSFRQGLEIRLNDLVEPVGLSCRGTRRQLKYPNSEFSSINWRPPLISKHHGALNWRVGGRVEGEPDPPFLEREREREREKRIESPRGLAVSAENTELEETLHSSFLFFTKENVEITTS